MAAQNNPLQNPDQDIYTAITSRWNLSPPQRALLSNYYILHWNTEWFLCTFPSNGAIKRDGITYLRIYHKCSHEHLAHSDITMLSFRKHPLLPYGTVLISPALSGPSKASLAALQKVPSTSIRPVTPFGSSNK